MLIMHHCNFKNKTSARNVKKTCKNTRFLVFSWIRLAVFQRKHCGCVRGKKSFVLSTNINFYAERTFFAQIRSPMRISMKLRSKSRYQQVIWSVFSRRTRWRDNFYDPIVNEAANREKQKLSSRIDSKPMPIDLGGTLYPWFIYKVGGLRSTVLEL